MSRTTTPPYPRQMTIPDPTREAIQRAADASLQRIADALHGGEWVTDACSMPDGFTHYHTSTGRTFAVGVP